MIHQFPKNGGKVERCSPAQAEARRAGCLLLDVRSPVEFATAKIEGAILRPLGSFGAEEVAGLAAGRREVILICQSGGRAEKAAETLRGRLPVTVLEGGMAAWEAAGLPVVRERRTISLERQVRIAAGALVLAGAALGATVHPGFYALAVLVGAGLVFAGVTNTCGMGLLLARMPWNRVAPGACCGKPFTRDCRD